MTAEDLIGLLGLEPHPEGGYFRQTFADEASGGRPFSTAIYYLLEGGAAGRWHRVDSAEVWHYYAGAPLRLTMSPDGVATSEQILGQDFSDGQRPQVVVPRGYWQSAQSLGNWTLVGCTVAPGFQFEHFEMAEEGWQPGQS
jgi:predicted cupin superfamily sugar epimerase